MVLEGKNIRGSMQEIGDNNTTPKKVGIGYDRPWRKAMSKNALNHDILPVSVSSVSPIPPKNNFIEGGRKQGLVRDASTKNISKP